MSYAFTVTGDARPDLRSLAPWLQEDVLDELDMLAADPTVLPTVDQGQPLAYSFSRVAGATRHHVTFYLGRNDMTRTLTVLGLAYRTHLIGP